MAAQVAQRELAQIIEAIAHLDAKLDAHLKEWSESRHEHGKLLTAHSAALGAITERRKMTAGALVSGTIALLSVIGALMTAWIAMDRRVTTAAQVGERLDRSHSDQAALLLTLDRRLSTVELQRTRAK